MDSMFSLLQFPVCRSEMVWTTEWRLTSDKQSLAERRQTATSRSACYEFVLINNSHRRFDKRSAGVTGSWCLMAKTWIQEWNWSGVEIQCVSCVPCSAASTVGGKVSVRFMLVQVKMSWCWRLRSDSGYSLDLHLDLGIWTWVWIVHDYVHVVFRRCKWSFIVSDLTKFRWGQN